MDTLIQGQRHLGTIRNLKTNKGGIYRPINQDQRGTKYENSQDRSCRDHSKRSYVG